MQEEIIAGRRGFIGGSLVAAAALVPAAQAAAAPRTGRGPLVSVEMRPEPPQVPAREGFIDVPGARLFYWDTGGSGEAIVLCHAATGSAACWGYQQPVFAKAGYRAIAYSRRGHFRSEQTDSAGNGSASEDLQALADQLRLDRFHLVGTAAGSMVVAQYVVSHPERLASAVISSSLMAMQDPEYQAKLKAVSFPNFGAVPPEFRELGPSYRALNPRGTARWLELERSSRTASAGRLPPPPDRQAGPPPMDAGAVEVTFDKLARSPVPMLIFTGDCDLYMSPGLLSYVAARLPNARFAVAENAGHAIFWEQPDQFNALVLGLVRQNGQRRRR